MVFIALILFFVLTACCSNTFLKFIVLCIALPAIGLAFGGFAWVIAAAFGLVNVNCGSFGGFVCVATILIVAAYLKARD